MPVSEQEFDVFHLYNFFFGETAICVAVASHGVKSVVQEYVAETAQPIAQKEDVVALYGDVNELLWKRESVRIGKYYNGFHNYESRKANIYLSIVTIICGFRVLRRCF